MGDQTPDEIRLEQLTVSREIASTLGSLKSLTEELVRSNNGIRTAKCQEVADVMKSGTTAMHDVANRMSQLDATVKTMRPYVAWGLLIITIMVFGNLLLAGVNANDLSNLMETVKPLAHIGAEK